MRADLRILRYDPERDGAPHWESYLVESEPMDRVLDLLHKVKYEQDGTLTFRRSCAHGVCGSDAMLINGRNRLACRIRVDQLGKHKITVAPLPGLPVVKDLVVDMEDFFDKYRSVKPYLITETPEPARERRQSAADRARYDDTTKCILCAACTSSCPSFWAQPAYVGPAAIVNAHRFIFDSRDEAADERLEILADKDGVWRCRIQLRRRVSSRHPYHAGDPRGLGSDRGASGLSDPDRPELFPAEDVAEAPTAEPSGAPGEHGAKAATRLRGGATHPHRLIVRTDGAARGNPGPASAGAVLIDAAAPDAKNPSAAPYATISGYLGTQTNNVAEYTAVLRAVSLAAELGAREVELMLDSMLIVEQLHGRWRVRDPKLAPLHSQVKRVLMSFDRWSAVHVPRAQNHAADALANEAIDRVMSGGPASVVRRPG